MISLNLRSILCIFLILIALSSSKKRLQWKINTISKGYNHLLHGFRKYLSCAILSSSVLSTCTLSPSPVYSISRGDLLQEAWSDVNDNYYDENFSREAWLKKKEEAFTKLNKGADEIGLIKEILSSLGDKYTRFLDKSVFESLWKFDAIGVGLLLQSDEGKPMVVASQPIQGSSGYEAGLVKGDIVYEVNGESTERMTAVQLLDKMSNDDRNTVQIVYSKAETPENKREITLKRSIERTDNPVTYKVENVNGLLIGYIRIAEFNAQTVNGMEEALKEISEKNADDLVIDLRGNLGGGFQFALNVGGMFLDNDAIMVTAKSRNKDLSTFRASYTPGVLWKKPVVLLTDALSASSSEVLAGGLRDNCRAVLAGEKTFGKGKIQAVFGLEDGEGMTMTVAQYVTPKGTIIQSKGLQPDIPKPVTNAYINYILGNINLSPMPNINFIDFAKVNEILTTCKGQ